MKVRLSEIFTSIEGEGVLYGTKTLFVRMAGCPFTCSYCDTPDSLPPDSGTEYTIQEASGMIDGALQEHTYKVNFTGGDPLMQHKAVALLAEHVHLHAAEKKLLTYLESSCFDAGRFAHVLPHIDITKIEFKTADSGFVDAEKHDKMTGQALLCLERAILSRKTTYVKIVAGSKTSVREVRDIAAAALDVSRKNSEPPQRAISGFVIQPVYGGGEPPLELLLSMYDAVRPLFPDVRVIPQLHKIIGAP